MVLNNLQQLLGAVCDICDDHNLRVTLHFSNQGAVIVGVSAFVGGILGGPRGIMVGSMLGGLVAMKRTEGIYIYIKLC